MSLIAAASSGALAGDGTLHDVRLALDQMPSTHGLLAPLRAAFSDRLPALDGATTWINTAPLTPAMLRGKVVLVEFWTYTCINWRREYPYVRAWAQKYRDHGLVVLGVHTPEFAFEKDVDNVRLAVQQIGVDHPIAVDSGGAVWRAFGNQAWPALYFVDSRGRIRHHRYGEGDYEASERLIQQLLSEAGSDVSGADLVSIAPTGAEAGADWASLRSGENYLGTGRTEGFASPGGARAGMAHTYAVPGSLALNQWALEGGWTLREDAAVVDQAGGRIVYRFHARDVHLVMGPATRGTAVRFRVLVDGKAPGAAHGVDVDEAGYGTVVEQRMYQLIRQGAPIGDRRFEIEFLGPGVEAYSFTFG